MDTNTACYNLARPAPKIRDGDLLLFRRRHGAVGKLISVAGRSPYCHAAMAAWWNGRLMCLETVQGHGGRAVLLSTLVATHPAPSTSTGGAWKGITTVMGKLTAIAGVVGRSGLDRPAILGPGHRRHHGRQGDCGRITAGLGWAGAAAWKTITSIGSGFSSLVGWAAAAGKGVVATIVAYFNQAGTAASDAVQWIADRFWSLLGTAAETWKGISNALAAGDIVLAARVLWAMLKMEWQKGVNFLSETWATFKETMMAVATEAVYGVATALTNGWALHPGRLDRNHVGDVRGLDDLHQRHHVRMANCSKLVQ